MRFDSLFRVLFIIYCVEAGIFLLVAPWTQFWDRWALQISVAAVRSACLAPAMRGAASGLGCAHLLWALHDVDTWLRERRSRARIGAPIAR